MYADLSTEKSIGMSLGPIPWTAIVKWCEFHELERDVARFAMDVVRLVDADSMRRESERAKNATPTRSRGRLGG